MSHVVTATRMPSPHFVTLIAPCRNERAHIDAFCDSALGQRLPTGW